MILSYLLRLYGPPSQDHFFNASTLGNSTKGEMLDLFNLGTVGSFDDIYNFSSTRLIFWDEQCTTPKYSYGSHRVLGIETFNSIP